jgi:predicted transposase YbfD/YdcC
MKYTLPTLHATSPTGQVRLPVSGLWAAFAALPDPRQRRCTYSLPALLSLAVAGLLCHQRSVLAIAQWGQRQAPALRAALGLPPDRAPDQSTLHRLFRRLAPAPLGTVLTTVFAPPPPAERAAQAVAVDGKAHRGQGQFEPATAGTIHEVTAFCHELGLALAQLAVDNQGGEAELSAARTLIGAFNWAGRVLTGDALYVQRDICATVVAGGGDYALVVKGNQPDLAADLATLFAAPEMGSAPAAARAGWDYRATQTVEKGHGRLEIRQAVASGELAGYSRWPQLRQVVQIRRRWQQRGQWYVAERYMVTSLPPEVAGPERLLELKRGHWQVENQLHYIKDVVLGEDASLIHAGNGGAVLAVLRDVAVNALRAGGERYITARLRANSQQPELALQLLGFAPALHA